MKIVDIQSTTVRIPYREPELWVWGVGHYGVNAIIIEVHTDEGIIGVGQGTTEHASSEYANTLLNEAKKYLVGKDPFDSEQIFRGLLGAGLTDIRVIAGIDMALWDIIGKACKKPLHKLLGGSLTEKIEFAPWINRKKTEDMAKDALRFVKEGFKAFYIKVGINPEDDIEAIKTVREAIGYKYPIRLDANIAWSPGTAVKMITKLEKYDIDFIEDPTYSYGMKRVKDAVKTPICSGAESPYEILRGVREEQADIFGHIDPLMTGGIMNCKKACAICEMAGLPVVLHAGWEISILVLATLHIVASTPNFILPNQTYYMYLKDDVCTNGMLQFEDGCMTVPNTPGLGVELDREKIQKYAKEFETKGGYTLFEPSKTKMMKKILPYSFTY